MTEGDQTVKYVKALAANTIKDGSGTWYYLLVDADGRTLVRDASGGDIYENEVTASTDAAFSVASYDGIVLDCVIQVVANPALFGDADHQRTLVEADGTLGLRYVNPSKLYAKNATAGSNATVRILGVKA